MGFLRFLDTIENKAKLNVHEYKQPKEYKFLLDEYETALGEEELAGKPNA